MRSPESVFFNRSRNENGSALLYILFLIALVSIVGSVMLTTVTQGQRNVVKSEGELTHFYKAEGAIEIIIEDLIANKGNEWGELESYINSSTGGDPIELSIGGDSVFINVVVPDPSTPIVNLIDSRDDNIYRIITFSYGSIIVGDYPFTPDPEAIGSFNDCYDVNGELVCETDEIPAVYEGPKPIIVIVGTGDQVEFTGNVEYIVTEGIYIEPDFTTFQGGSSITFDSGGFIIIDNASFQTNQGNSTINMDANTYFSAKGSTIVTSVGNGSINLSAGTYFNLTDATIDVGTGQSSQIDLIAGSCININGAYFSKTPTIQSPIIVGTPRAGSADVQNSDPNGTCP